ncbi:MAG: type II secretion system ATPase GspE [Leptospirillia bacterium]
METTPAGILGAIRTTFTDSPVFDDRLEAAGFSRETLWKGWAEGQGYGYRSTVALSDLDGSLIPRIPIGFAKSHLVLPLSLAEEAGSFDLSVLCGSPASFEALDRVADLLLPHEPPVRIRPILLPPPTLLSLINNAYERHGQAETGQILDRAEEQTDDAFDLLAIQETVDLLDAKDDAPIIRLANSILSQAVKQKASDIHLEPFEEEVKVRYRLDGVLYNILSIPQKLKAGILSRFKLMANLNIAEKRLPQDGRIRIRAAGRDVDIRVSTIPVRHGERVVLRILEQGTLLLPLSEIGFAPEDLAQLNRLISLTSGIVLVTGPTGAGKTTTLYAILNTINSPDKNIITIEDPVEYQLRGIGQIQVNPRISLTFASGLRSILRQDPDVILIGEIRDTETAEIAIQASLTGHLVFSTLHTNDAPSAMTRLIDMGVEPFLISTSVRAVLAQRLVRKICPSCRTPYRPSPDELSRLSIDPSMLPDGRLFHGTGCPDCLGTGYKGRQGIYELFVLDPDIAHLVNIREDAAALREAGRKKGMQSLTDDGRRKVLEGITTIEEVLRVAQSEIEAG